MKSLIIKHTELTEMDSKIISILTNYDEKLKNDMTASELAGYIEHGISDNMLNLKTLNELYFNEIVKILKYAYEMNMINRHTHHEALESLINRNVYGSSEQEIFYCAMYDIMYSVSEKWLHVLIHDEFLKLSCFMYA